MSALLIASNNSATGEINYTRPLLPTRPTVAFAAVVAFITPRGISERVQCVSRGRLESKFNDQLHLHDIHEMYVGPKVEGARGVTCVH